MVSKIEDNINLLIETLVNSDSFLTVAKLSERLSVSQRTIHNYLNSSSFKLKIGNANLIKTPNKGILLNANKETKWKIKKNIKTEIPIRSHDKADFISILLLFLSSNNVYQPNQLEEKYFLSSSSLRSLINKINDFIKSFSCEITYERSTGFKIVGEERNIRSLLTFILLDHINGTQQQQGSSHSRLTLKASKSLEYFLNKSSINKLMQIIDNTELLFNTYLCDADYSLLAIHLIVIILRTRQKEYLKETRQKNIENTQEYLNARVIVRNLEQDFYLDLPEEEVINLAMILISLRKQVNSLPIDYEIKIVDKFIEEVGYKLNVDLSKSENLKRNLLTHLRPAITRLKHGISSNNLLIEKIKNEYTDTYIAVMMTIDKLEKEENVKFDANEIGFICLHILAEISERKDNIFSLDVALICNEGMSLELFLKNMIESSFPDINVSKIIRTSEAKKYNFIDYDLVLNSTNLDFNSPNIINISPQLSNYDIKMITKNIKTYKQQEYDDIIKEEHLLFFKDNLDSKDKIISKYCKFLEENNYVTENYYDSVIARMKINNTYVARGIAVPHGNPDFVIKPTIAIIILDKPTQWDHNKVQIILFIVLDNSHHKNFNLILRKIMRIAASNQKTQKLLNCKNKEDLYNIITSA